MECFLHWHGLFSNLANQQKNPAHSKVPMRLLWRLSQQKDIELRVSENGAHSNTFLILTFISPKRFSKLFQIKKCDKVYIVFLSVQNIHINNFLSFIPVESKPHPLEVKSRDTMSSSVETSALHLSHEEGTSPGQRLTTDTEESSSTEFGALDVKHLLYEDERDFKVRLMRRQLWLLR